MSKMNWTKEQEQAILLENQNIIVSAGAGSGKTAVLTTRIIRKLKEGIRAQQLLVLTFTNAAAAEMKNRVLQKMKNDTDLVQRIPEVEQAYITTFDSFALSVVKKYHYLLGLTKEIHIIESSIMDLQAQEFLKEIFEEFYKSKDADFLKMIDHFTIKDDQDLLNCLLTIHKKLDQKADKSSYLQSYMQDFASQKKQQQYIEEYYGFIQDHLQQVKPLFLTIIPYLKEDENQQLYFELLNSKNYEKIYALLQNITPLKVQTEEIEIKETKKQIDKLIKNLKSICIYSSIEQIKDSLEDAKSYEKVIVAILMQLDSYMQEYKMKYQAFEFVDIAKMALSLVNQFPSVKENLTNQFAEILIDEYQDTNDLQELFIQKIARNNVYMVGDIKQSIYRFRNANPDIFMHKYENYKAHNGGIKIDLTNNFRSNKGIIDCINALFSKLMTKEIGGADYMQGHTMNFGFLRYNEIQKEPTIEYITYENEQKKYKDEDIELFYVVSDILKKIKNQMPVYDTELETFRPCTYQDFAILLEKSQASEKIQKLLQYYHIPATIFKNDNLLEGDLFYAMYNILIALQKIKQQELDSDFLKAYYGLGRSFLCSQSDDELYFAIKNNTITTSILYQKLQQLVQMATLLSNQEMILKIIEVFEIHKKLILIGEIETNNRRLQQFVSIAQNLTALNISIFEMGKVFEKLLQENKKIEIPASTPLQNQVKIMTIHKSKGLEFPICYFILNFSKQNEEEKTNKITYNEKYGLIPPFYANGQGETIKKILAKQDYDLQSLSEKIRLFYVALTRCRENMVLLNKKTTAQNKQLNECKTFKDLLDYVDTNFSQSQKLDLSTLVIHYRYLNVKEVEVSKKEIKPTRIVHSLQIETEPLQIKEKASKTIQHLITKQEKEKMNLGIAIHELFEWTDFKQDKKDVHPLVFTFLKQDLLKNIQEATIYKEFPFSFVENQKVYSGVIDLILEYSNHVDIIDYKLKNIDDEAYSLQLKIYQKYVAKMLKKPVFLYLYSILEGKMTKIED